VWHFFRSQIDWNLLLLVSVMVAPYAWFTDEAVLLPAILAGIFLAADNKQSLMPFYVIAGIAFLEVLCGVVTNSGFYVWTAPAWVLWYLLATRGQASSLPRKTVKHENLHAIKV
jgi:uncharacterized membrane protein (DUF106 family)